jgi:hypothetical protein
VCPERSGGRAIKDSRRVVIDGGKGGGKGGGKDAGKDGGRRHLDKRRVNHGKGSRCAGKRLLIFRRCESREEKKGLGLLIPLCLSRFACFYADARYSRLLAKAPTRF